MLLIIFLCSIITSATFKIQNSTKHHPAINCKDINKENMQLLDGTESTNYDANNQNCYDFYKTKKSVKKKSKKRSKKKGDSVSVKEAILSGLMITAAVIICVLGFMIINWYKTKVKKQSETGSLSQNDPNISSALIEWVHGDSTRTDEETTSGSKETSDEESDALYEIQH